MIAFLALHVAVVCHYVVRNGSRDWLRHLVVPVIGFAILLFVVINAERRRAGARLHLDRHRRRRARRSHPRQRTPTCPACPRSRRAPTTRPGGAGVRKEDDSRERTGRPDLPAHGRRAVLHVRRPGAGAPGSGPATILELTPRTASAAWCAASATCRRRCASSRTSTRSPGRSTSRAPSRATPSRCTSSSIAPARDWAVSSTFPHFGALTAHAHHGDAARRRWRSGSGVYDVDRGRAAPCATGPGSSRLHAWTCRSTRCTARSASRRRAFEARMTIVPDAHGGNMDTPELRAGVTVYFGVNVPGALFALGDGHAGRATARCAASASRRRWTPSSSST